MTRWAGVPDVTDIDGSEDGGEGGVGVSETVDEADFVGGVAIVGEDVVVVGEFSEAGDPGRSRLGFRGVGFRSRCRAAAASA